MNTLFQNSLATMPGLSPLENIQNSQNPKPIPNTTVTQIVTLKRPKNMLVPIYGKVLVNIYKFYIIVEGRIKILAPEDANFPRYFRCK